MSELISKISKAAIDVGGKLSADKTNKEQMYDYLSADKILSICGQALFNQGLVIVPVITAQETALLEYTDKYDKKRSRYDSRINFNFSISDGETTLECPWVGMGSDYTVPDKALYKAITSGHKYFLMKLLSVGAGNEDGDHEEENEKKAEKKVEQKQIVKVVPAELPIAEISLETAMNVTTSDGLTYGSLSDADLQHRLLGIKKALAKNDISPEQREEYEYKRSAAVTILNSRQPAQ